MWGGLNEFWFGCQVIEGVLGWFRGDDGVGADDRNDKSVSFDATETQDLIDIKVAQQWETEFSLLKTGFEKLVVGINEIGQFLEEGGSRVTNGFHFSNVFMTGVIVGVEGEGATLNRAGKDVLPIVTDDHASNDAGEAVERFQAVPIAVREAQSAIEQPTLVITASHFGG